jgi:hypothetical protein
MYIIGTNGGFWANAYGKLYSRTYDGCIYCYDLKTGKYLWKFSTGNSGLNTPYGTWALAGPETIADGKVFACVGEHSPNSPLWEGAEMHAVNTTTGQEVWHISGWMQNPAVSDGYLVTLNGYDNQVYCFGKGQTATAVTASPKTSVQGNAVLIEGTVTDQSPGATGTPAISDASMTPWMEYLYQQQPKPTNATGVPVTLSVFDSNNNTYTVGTTTSDVSGNYAFQWTPPVPGLYKVTATFEGSESYYTSSAETAVSVTAAPSAQVSATAPAQTAAPTPTSSPVQSSSPSPSQAPQPTSGMPTTTYIAIGAAVIVVVAAAAALVLRKRKSKP